jgi:hypothetical protein
VATREELEAQIEAAPTEDGAYVILGDLLQLEGDPRGELIALDAAYLRGSDRAAWSERRLALLGQHLELQPRTASRLHYTWHLGFVRRISLGSSANLLAAFGHPSLRFVTELVFLEPTGSEFLTTFVEACERTPLLRSLAIGDPDHRHYHSPRERTLLDLPSLLDSLSTLEELYACEPVEIAAAPRLRWLRLEGDSEVWTRLARAKLPALECLSVRDGAPAPVSWLIDHPPPALHTLELIGANGNQLIAALVGSRLLAQLRTLRLWNAGLTPDGARKITSEAFGHLELLDLSDPLLDDDTIALVSGVCREVRTISPWMREITNRAG